MRGGGAEAPLCSMDRPGLHQLEERDLGFESGAVGALHVEDAGHGSEGGGEWTAGRVLEGLTRLEDRLFADDTRPVDFFRVARTVYDRPMPIEKLHRRLAFVGDADRIQEEPTTRGGGAVLVGESRANLHTHTLRHGVGGRFEEVGVTHERENSSLLPVGCVLRRGSR